MGAEAAFTRSWLASAPENERRLFDKEMDELAANVVQAAIQTAREHVEAEEKESARAEAAERERLRRQRLREAEVTPPVRKLRARDDVDPGNLSLSGKSTAGPSSQGVRLDVNERARSSLARVYAKKRVRKENVVHGNRFSLLIDTLRLYSTVWCGGGVNCEGKKISS